MTQSKSKPRTDGPPASTIQLRGKSYTLPKLGFKEIRAIMDHIRDQRINPLVMAIDATANLPAEQREKLLAIAYQDAKQNRVLAKHVGHTFVRGVGLAFAGLSPRL